MTFSVRGSLSRASVALFGAFVAVACAAEGSSAAEIDEAEDATGRTVSVPDAAKASKDASVDAHDASPGDARWAAPDATPAVDSGLAHDAAKDGGPKPTDAAKDSNPTGADCPVNPTYIAKAFAELLGSSPTMCLNSPCPASKCCLQLYGVCVDK